VQHGYPTRKPSRKPTDRLRGEGYFGDQDDGLLPRGQHVLQDAQVDLRLPAPGHAMEQEYLGFPLFQAPDDLPPRFLLSRGQLERGAGHKDTSLERIPPHLLLLNLYEALVQQGSQSGTVTPHLGVDVGYGGWASFVEILNNGLLHSCPREPLHHLW